MPLQAICHRCAQCGALIWRQAPDGAIVRCATCIIGRPVGNVPPIRDSDD